MAVLASLTLTSAASAQSAVDNIRPVGQVCMAGQPCEGQPMGDASAASSSAASAPAAAAQPADPAPEPAAEESVMAASDMANDAVADSGSDAAATYQSNCMACHATGAAGAPMVGNKEAWDAKMEKGMDAVMTNVMNGINAMPAKGLCMSCSYDDLQAVVEYMVAQSQ
jgi:cytochrome c5